MSVSRENRQSESGNGPGRSAPGGFPGSIRSLFRNSHENFGLAASMMLIGLSCLSLQDALVKLISQQTTLWQLQAFRGSFNLILLLVLVAPLIGVSSWRARKPGWVILRGALQMAAMLFFFGAAPLIDLTQMAAGLYTFPLFVGLFGIWFNDKPGIWRVLAIVTGFAGSALVLQPDLDQLSIFSLMPIAAGFCYAWFVIITRTRCRHEEPLVLVVVSNIVIAASGWMMIIVLNVFPVSASLESSNAFLFSADSPVTWMVITIVFVTSLLNTTGNLSLSKAYQSADSSRLAPIDYSYLIIATFWGVLLFNVKPDATSVVGLILIALGGIVVMVRGRLLVERKA